MVAVDYYSTLRLDPTGQIRFREENPKRKASAAHARYEKYKAAKTVSEFHEISLALGSFAKQDFENDFSKGYVTYCKAEATSPSDDRAASGAAKHDKLEKLSKNTKPLAATLKKTPEMAVSQPEASIGSGGASRSSPPRPSAASAAMDGDKGVAKRARTAVEGGRQPREDDSLFSLVELPRKEAAPEAKPSKQVMEPQRTARAMLPQPKAVARKRKALEPQTSTSELVRDVVPDYVEGQPDPSGCEESLKKKAAFLSDREPMMPLNRTKFVWVVQQESHVFSHDPKMAGPLMETQRSSARCAVCSQKCYTERTFRVRCYLRRSKGDPPEWKHPRKMRAEQYYVGTRCMEALLGTAPISTSQVRQLRERLHRALEARDFQLDVWASVLRRVEREQLPPFAELLAGELRGVRRRRAADEKTDKFQASTRLGDLQTFEDREKHRQWRLDQVVLKRCKDLLEMLQEEETQKVADRMDESTKVISAPNVIDDLLSIATKGAVTTESLRLRPRPAGPAEQVFILDSPTKQKEASGEALAEEQTPSSPQAVVPPGFEPWDGADSLDVLSLEMTGFHRGLLNRNFIADKVTRVNDARTFWDESRDVFMYWQHPSKRWSICQRWDKDADLLVKVRRGAELGWAFFASPGVWKEFWRGEWRKVSVATRKELQVPTNLMQAVQASTPAALYRLGQNMLFQVPAQGGQPSTDAGPPPFASAVTMDPIKLQVPVQSVQPGVASMLLQDSTHALRGSVIQCDTPPLPSMRSFD
ncbi:unnamed protein product [Symbiodinium sp. CCMP2456]|nr:unnamed protein product [Symbiodinium sp. CCMP2456]